MISPDFLAELDRFDARLARRARSRRRGERESPRRGEGLTFADYRRYAPGDEPRRVDWKLYARTETLYVKQFEAERSATLHVLLDASGSMAFGEGDADKFDCAARLGLGCAYLAARDHDDFRVSVFGERLERIDAGPSNRGELLDLIERCNEREPAGEAAFEEALSAYAGTIRSKALVVVLSDFLADPDEVAAGLGALADADLVTGHVVAPGEREPPATGDTVFEALESERSLRTYFGQRRAREYRERLEAHLDDVAAAAGRLGARHEPVDTGRPFLDSFADLWSGLPAGR